MEHKVELKLPDSSIYPIDAEKLNEINEMVDKAFEKIVNSTNKILKISRMIGISDKKIAPYIEIFFENWTASFFKNLEITIEKGFDKALNENKVISNNEKEDSEIIQDNKSLLKEVDSMVKVLMETKDLIEQGNEHNKKENLKERLSSVRERMSRIPFQNMDEEFATNKITGIGHKLFDKISVGFFNVFNKAFAKVIASAGLLTILGGILTPFIYRVFLNWGEIISKEFENVSDFSEITSKIINSLNVGGMAASGGLAGAVIGMFFGPLGALLGAVIGAVLGGVIGAISDYFGPKKVAEFLDGLISKEGKIGATLGVTLGAFLGPLGAIVGAVLGAVAGSLTKILSPQIIEIKEKISTMFNEKFNNFLNLMQPIFDFFTNIYNSISNYISNSLFMLNNTYEKISSNINQIVENINGIIKYSISIFDDVILKIKTGYEKAIDIKNNVVDSISEKINEINNFFTKISNIFSDIVNSIKDSKLYKFFFKDNDLKNPIKLSNENVTTPNSQIKTSVTNSEDVNVKSNVLKQAATEKRMNDLVSQSMAFSAAMQSSQQSTNVNNMSSINTNNNTTNVISAKPSPHDNYLAQLSGY